MAMESRSSGLDLSKLNFDTILVRRSERGYNLLPIPEFLELPVDQRIEMILERRIRFVNGEDEVSPYAALESLDRCRKERAA